MLCLLNEFTDYDYVVMVLQKSANSLQCIYENWRGVAQKFMALVFLIHSFNKGLFGDFLIRFCIFIKSTKIWWFWCRWTLSINELQDKTQITLTTSNFNERMKKIGQNAKNAFSKMATKRLISRIRKIRFKVCKQPSIEWMNQKI